MQYDLNGNFIREWESVCEAGKFYGLCYGASGIRTACNNPNRTCKGFKWKYKETNEERENIKQGIIAELYYKEGFKDGIDFIIKHMKKL